MSSALALTSSLLWGTSDFFGGIASRRHHVLRVLAWSQLCALILLWTAVTVGVLGFGLDVQLRTLLLGAAGGMAGAIGIAAFYRALATGPMALVPPIAAAGVVLPVAVGLATGDRPSMIVYAGLAIAIIGVILASVGETPPDASGFVQRIAPSTLVLCLIAATGFALLFIAVDAAADDVGSALVATAGLRGGGITIIAIGLLVTRTAPWRVVTPINIGFFAVIGIFDTGANLLFAIATSLGRLEVAAVLASLYPAVTSLLAHVVLGDRLGRLQIVGVIVALAGVTMLASR
ncbi:MAG: DMT family transporter [Gaiellales bacterium]